MDKKTYELENERCKQYDKYLAYIKKLEGAKMAMLETTTIRIETQAYAVAFDRRKDIESDLTTFMKEKLIEILENEIMGTEELMEMI